MKSGLVAKQPLTVLVIRNVIHLPLSALIENLGEEYHNNTSKLGSLQSCNLLASKQFAFPKS